MAEITSVPSGDYSGELEWAPTPSGTHYTTVDEGETNKNTTDYIYKPGYPYRDRFHFPADAPANMDTVTEVRIRMYLKVKKQASEPGLSIVLIDGRDESVMGSRVFASNTSDAWVVRDAVFPQTQLNGGAGLDRDEYQNMDIRFRTTLGDAGVQFEEVP